MKELKNVLFYISSGIALIALSIMFTGRLEVDIPPLPTATPPAIPTATALAQTDCLPTPSESSYGYLPDPPITTRLVSDDYEGLRLFMSGTVYASDCETPLPGVHIEIWQNDAKNTYPAKPGYLRAQLRTDSHGRYRFATVKPLPSRNRPGHIHFRVSYPDGSNTLDTLIYFDDVIRHNAPAIDPRLAVSTSKVTGASGSRLYGTFDIVLPVKPPETKLPDCLATPHHTGAQPNSADAPFTNTLAADDLSGARLIISGAVYAADGQTPVPNALLEIWHANAQGRYVSTSTSPLRAKMYTNTQGRFEFTTIKPGPVRVGCQYLPAHINYLVSYGDKRPLYVTQFFADDPHLDNYPQVQRQAVTTLIKSQGEDSTLRGTFDIVLPERSARRQ